jgi:hypothetical protein
LNIAISDHSKECLGSAAGGKNHLCIKIPTDFSKN